MVSGLLEGTVHKWIYTVYLWYSNFTAAGKTIKEKMSKKAQGAEERYSYEKRLRNAGLDLC